MRSLVELLILLGLIGAVVISLRPIPVREVKDFSLGEHFVYKGKMDGKFFVDQGELQREKDGRKDTYTGTFLAGRPDGTGSFRSAEGWIYEGAFNNGKAQGSASLTDDFFVWHTENGKDWVAEAKETENP